MIERRFHDQNLRGFTGRCKDWLTSHTERSQEEASRVQHRALRTNAKKKERKKKLKESVETGCDPKIHHLTNQPRCWLDICSGWLHCCSGICSGVYSPNGTESISSLSRTTILNTWSKSMSGRIGETSSTESVS